MGYTCETGRGDLKVPCGVDEKSRSKIMGSKFLSVMDSALTERAFCKLGSNCVKRNDSGSDRIKLYYVDSLKKIVPTHESGYYSEPIKIEFSGLSEDDLLYYTLDGSNPSTKGVRYNGSIKIKGYRDFNIQSNTPTTPLTGPDRLNSFIWKEPRGKQEQVQVIRYQSYRDGEPTSDVYTNTYIIENRHGSFTYPIISLVADPKDLFGHERGVLIPGRSFEKNGWKSDYWPTGNYSIEGKKGEREAVIEYFNNSGGSEFKSKVGIRVHGNSTASFPQKSIRVYFDEEYGSDKLEYKFFPESDTKYFKRLILRNAGNDFLKARMRDVLAQHYFGLAGLEIQRFKPVIAFINGEYWGVYYLRERQDQYYLKYNFDLPKDEIEMYGTCNVQDYGDKGYAAKLKEYLEDNDIAKDKVYATVSKMIDLDNFMDYYILQTFFGNYDWPGNNLESWRTEEDQSKLRFLVKDLDNSMEYDNSFGVNYNFFEHASVKGSENYYNPDCSTFLFRTLLRNEAFKTEFISRYIFHLNNLLSVRKMIEKIDDLKALFEPEMQRHINRWGYPESVNVWKNEVHLIKEFVRQRHCVVKDHLIDFFRLDDIAYDCRESSELLDNDDYTFPNPSSGLFNIYSKEISEGDYFEVWVKDLTGRTISGLGVYANKFNQLRIDLRSCVKNSTMCFIEVKGVTLNKTFKVFIER